MNPQTTFTFQGYDAQIEKGCIIFHYQVLQGEGKIELTEKISFKPRLEKNIPDKLLKNILNNLLLILGISYWKLYCPKDIRILPFSLTKEQAEFWNAVYTKGLGEFFYRNQIDYRRLVQFPYKEEAVVHPVDVPQKDRSLVLIGGGKDSLVTGELLKKARKPFTAFVVNPTPIHQQTIEVMHSDEIIFKREIDPQLFVLNKEKGTYNGHVPATAINSFLAVFAAVLYDYGYIIVSNEKSANYGNVSYLGEEINHQWSKSEEFEYLFKNYINSYITPNITYFSLLRPLSEIAITKLFSQYEQYSSVFSSCNRNFVINTGEPRINTRWCGKCPKCLFVFTMLAAFLSKENVIRIFGKNLFEDRNLEQLFRELLGLGEIKPFECVGTPEEMQLALAIIREKGEFENTPLMKIFLNEVSLNKKKVNELKKQLFTFNTNVLTEKFRVLLHSL